MEKENISSIKKQLLDQIESSQNIPASHKEELKSQISLMGDDEFLEFLKKNNMSISPENKNENNNVPSAKTCVFCLIIEGKIQSYKIDENKESIAILEINPLSEGHSIIVPKNHTRGEVMNEGVLRLAKKISKKIQSKLKPESIDMSSSEVHSHGIINLIPRYANKNLEKKQETKENLEILQKKLAVVKKEKKIKSPPLVNKESANLPKVPKRIP